MLKFGASSFISQVVFQTFVKYVLGSTNNVVNILTNSVT